MNSVNRNVVLSTLANLTTLVVRSGQQLLWVPLFLAAFGKEGYGEWLTLFGLAGYVAMADIGIQHYWLNLLTGAYVRGDIEDYQRIYRAGLLLFSTVGVVVFLTCLVFGILGGPSKVLGLKAISASVASGVFLVISGSTLLVVLTSMVRGVFRTVGQNPKVVWFGTTRESLIFALVVGVLLLGVGPLGLSWVYGGVAVFMLIWVLITVRWRFPKLADFRIYRADWRTVKSLLGGGSIHLAGVLANLLLVQGTLIITNWALGAASVALVAMSRTISNLVLQSTGAIYVSTLPEFSRLEAANDKLAMEKLLRRSMSFILMISGLACIFLVSLGPWLFDIWTGGRFPNSAPLIYLFAASVMVDALRQPLHSFLYGCNRIAWASISNIIYAVSCLVMMWLLFPRLGTWSVPVATMICGAIVHFPLVLKASSFILSRDFVVCLLGKFGLSISLVAVISIPLGILLPKDFGILWLFIGSAGALVGFITIFWKVVFVHEDTVLLWKQIARFKVLAQKRI